MNPVLRHMRSNVIAYLALFVALGGTSYAAFSLPPGSVGTRELKNHAITPVKFDRHSIGAYVRAWAVIKGGNHVVASRPRARVVSWDASFAAGVLSWGSAISRKCFPLATGSTDSVQASVLPGPHNTPQLHFQAYDASGRYDPTAAIIFLSVICPQG